MIARDQAHAGQIEGGLIALYLVQLAGHRLSG
jgi:hypothetical protein